MARPGRKPREAKEVNAAFQLESLSTSLAAIQTLLFGIKSLDEATAAVDALAAIKRQARDMENAAKFIQERFAREAELSRQLDAVTQQKPAKAKQQQMAAE